MTIQIDYPFAIGGNGRTALATDDDHIRDLIELVLFTMPGERVNRPTFGSNLSQMIFAPNSSAAASAIQLAVQGALLQTMSDRIVVNSVDVVASDSTLTVTVSYVVRSTQQTQVVELTKNA